MRSANVNPSCVRRHVIPKHPANAYTFTDDAIGLRQASTQSETMHGANIFSIKEHSVVSGRSYQQPIAPPAHRSAKIFVTFNAAWRAILDDRLEYRTLEARGNVVGGPLSAPTANHLAFIATPWPNAPSLGTMFTSMPGAIDPRCVARDDSFSPNLKRWTAPWACGAPIAKCCPNKATEKPNQLPGEARSKSGPMSGRVQPFQRRRGRNSNTPRRRLL